MVDPARALIVQELVELIAALDRRVPMVQRVGEITIAREASALRTMAIERLKELDPDAARRAAGDSSE
jgi:hypothetical protein